MAATTGAAPVGAARRQKGLGRRLEPYLYLAPWLVGFVLFTLGPFIASFALSLTRYEFFAAPVFIGLDNYVEMFTDDPKLFRALLNTFVYMLGHIPLTMLLAFFCALLLNQRLPGMAIFRTLYYLPAVTTSVATAVIWSWIFQSEFGLLNGVLRVIGIQGPAWLADTRFAMIAFVIMSLWSIGGTIVIYLAALQGVPESLYEAAAIDGAGWWRRTWHVTVPMITPTILFTLILQIIGSFQVFTTAFVLTNGGPGDSTLFYVLHLYTKAFVSLRLGYASALAWVLFILILAFTALQVWLSRRWVYYEGEAKG